LLFQSLNTFDILFLARAFMNATSGLMDRALLELEGILLRDALNKDKAWYGTVLLAICICRIYTCNPEKAAVYAADSQGLNLERGLGDFRLISAIADRLRNNLSAALETYEWLEHNLGLLNSWNQEFIRDWHWETRLRAGFPTFPEDVAVNILRNEVSEQHPISGLTAAMLYRASFVVNYGDKLDRELLIRTMNQSPAFERPLLTMLLEDILPRPLEGVEIVSDLSNETSINSDR
jgi:hypothetical protein